MLFHLASRMITLHVLAQINFIDTLPPIVTSPFIGDIGFNHYYTSLRIYVGNNMQGKHTIKLSSRRTALSPKKIQDGFNSFSAVALLNSIGTEKRGTKDFCIYSERSSMSRFFLKEPANKGYSVKMV